MWTQGTVGPKIVTEKGSPILLFPFSIGKSVFSGIHIVGILRIRRRQKDIEERIGIQNTGKLRKETFKGEESHNEF